MIWKVKDDLDKNILIKYIIRSTYCGSGGGGGGDGEVVVDDFVVTDVYQFDMETIQLSFVKSAIHSQMNRTRNNVEIK